MKNFFIVFIAISICIGLIIYINTNDNNQCPGYENSFNDVNIAIDFAKSNNLQPSKELDKFFDEIKNCSYFDSLKASTSLLIANADKFYFADKDSIKNYKIKFAEEWYDILEDYDNKIDAALKKFKLQTDDFNPTDFYVPSNFTHYNNSNNISLYFSENNISYSYRLRVSYTGNDWIFFDKIILSTDGETKTFYFDRYSDIQTKVLNGGDVYEKADIVFNTYDFKFLKQFVEAKNPKYRLSGEYYKDFNLKNSNKIALKNVIEFYELHRKRENHFSNKPI